MSARLGIRSRTCASCPRLGSVVIVACALAIALVLAGQGAARADVFSPIEMVSSGSVGGTGFIQQAEYAHDAAISANGRYVAFDGSVGGVTGVWRKNLATGVIEQVAGGDAAMPSISEEGRYVSFTTNEGASLSEITHVLPDAAPKAEAVNVYRRDMDYEPAAAAAEEAARPATERAFLAASTPSGSEDPLRYTNVGEHGGSYAVGRSAISADGNEVAFITASMSNLVPYPRLEEEERERGETPAPHTPLGQVAVHQFESDTTELVSRCRFQCEQGAAAGAAEPVVTDEVESKAVGAVTLAAASFPQHARDGAWPGASISADGSTVAWLGKNLAQQAPTLADEGLEPSYEEPLWRKLPAAGSQTRRVTGGSDPEAPACAASGELRLPVDGENASDPCQGPFVREQAGSGSGDGFIKHQIDDVTPRLSKNGEEVAFGANARLVAEGSDFNRGEEGNPTDLFVVNMHPGLIRTQAITQVTEVGAKSEAESAEITDYEISPDGRQVAFSTLRTRFVLGEPTLISVAPGEVGIQELYDADLADGTITRITHGYGGEGEQSQQPHPANSEQSGDPYNESKPLELGALTPDFSASGNQLVFTSTADNLVYDDGNDPEKPVTCCQAGDGSDVFIVTRKQLTGDATPQAISTTPQPAIAPAWQLGVTAHSLANGRVVLYVQAPGAGTLRAGAQGAVVVAPSRSARRRRAAHHARAAHRTVAQRTVASRSAKTKGAGPTTLTLTLASHYAGLASERGGFSATVTVTFAAAGHKTLRQSIPVTFVRKAKVSKDKAKGKPGGAHSSKAKGRR
jgi:hypothetical protein